MDIQLFDKRIKGIGHGWDYRQGVDPKTIIIHTTNGNRFSSYTAERSYIYNSRSISAHYLVGKQSQITQFLDPVYRAWHTGAVNDPRFNNNNSIGIEVHYTPGEGSWSKPMFDALTWLVKQLIKKYSIATNTLVETHRKVAIPKGRKIDPSGFIDAEFYVWRNRLFEVEIPPLTRYRVVVERARIRTSPRIADNNIAGIITKGTEFESVVTKIDENLQYLYGINTWAHITHGNYNGNPINGLGFVHTSNLTIIR